MEISFWQAAFPLLGGLFMGLLTGVFTRSNQGDRTEIFVTAWIVWTFFIYGVSLFVFGFFYSLK